MRKVDAFLSRKAQEMWPTAIVWKEEASSATLRLDGSGNSHAQVFILQRAGNADVILGQQFPQAKAQLEALIQVEYAKKSVKEPGRHEILSRRAQEMWPTAIVYEEQASSETLRLDGSGNSQQVFILQRQGHGDIIIGHQLGEAKAGLEALLASERSRRGSSKDSGEEAHHPAI